MNRGITSAPMNWGIDHSQNRAGEIMGNAISNTGNVLGNAIMQFAQDKRKREEKKAKEEAAARFILASGAGKAIGIKDEKGALEAVKGIGVDNAMGMIQLQQRQQQIEQEAEQAKQQNALLQQKAAQAEREATAAKQFLGQVAGQAPWRNAPASTPQDVFAAASRTGADPRLATSVANTLPAPPKPAAPVEFIQDPQTGARFMKQGNSVLPSNAPKVAAPKPPSTEFKVGGKTYTIGPGNRYFDEEGKPVSFGDSPGAAMAALVDALGVKPAQEPPKPAATPEDAAALEWLKENPNDPDAVGVSTRLRAKGLL